MYALDDTIAAISTPIGQGGIGIVRLSGDDALAIASRLFVPAANDWRQGIVANRLYYGHIVAPDTQHTLDEVLLSYMAAPHTYTRQDIVEINAHGGIVPLRETLSLCLASGARLALEGEFTLRAFLNGRLDLAQAEAVLDIISAKTDASLRVAVDQLGGRLSGHLREIRADLLKSLAYLEATIDFPEDEIPPHDVGPTLQRVAQQLAELLQESERGILYRNGVHTAIVGRPNVGKSSLLNALLRTDRAIVTSIPGTTRDTLEETLSLQGIPLVLVDTAGIADTDDMIEQLGIERSRRSVQRADLVLIVVDGSTEPTLADRKVAEIAAERTAVVVVNKSDLPQVHDYASLSPQAAHIAVSSLTYDGIPSLESLLVETILSGRVLIGDTSISSNPRHRDLFRQALAHTQEAEAALGARMPNDLIAIDVGEAVYALGQVTGDTAGDELLETIFSSFCIGK